jgi:hypothetical protein
MSMADCSPKSCSPAARPDGCAFIDAEFLFRQPGPVHTSEVIVFARGGTHTGEDRDVFLSRRLHLSQFPDGHDCDIRICRMVLALVITSYFGIFAYLITQGKWMAERNAQQAQQARDELRHVVGF